MNGNSATPRHTITALVQDRPGVLNRVSSMFRRRGFNIASLAVGHSEVPDMSRMTFVVEGDEHVVEQITKNLHKLIDVIKVTTVSARNVVSRELALIKIRADESTRSEIVQIVEIFRASIVGVAPDHLIIEVAGDEDKLESLLELLKRFGLMEVMRTGTIVMDRWMGKNRREDTAAANKKYGEAGSV
jgi:acetolactate synthase-1/3 small subunit